MRPAGKNASYKLAANGITLNGFKFMTIQANSDEVIGRKGVGLCRLAKFWWIWTLTSVQERGVFIIPTTQAILVAEVSQETRAPVQSILSKSQYDAPVQAGDANIVVSKLATTSRASDTRLGGDESNVEQSQSVIRTNDRLDDNCMLDG